MINNILIRLLGGFAGNAITSLAGEPVVVTDASASGSKAVHKAQETDGRLDRLVLVCMAMWSLLKEKTGMTEEDLLKRVQEIDLSDGQLDGKVRPPHVTCQSCGRMMSPRHLKCIYCGVPRADGSAFNTAT